VSSGFLGLFNALSSVADGEGVACLNTALRDEISVIPMSLSALTSSAVDLLIECFEECERAKEGGGGGGGGGSMRMEARGVEGGEEGDSMPSPLRTRATEGPKILYASDARVAVEISLRAIGDLPPSATEPWLRLLVALRSYACPEYKRAEVDAALLNNSDI